MSSDWWGMAPSVLDETPQISQVSSNLSPSIGDYLSMFQEQNHQWRQSIQPSFNMPYIPVSGDGAVTDSILNDNNPTIFSPWARNGRWRNEDEYGDSSSDDGGAPAGTPAPSMGMAHGLGIMGTVAGLGLGAPGLGTVAGALGAISDVSVANDQAQASFGVPSNEISLLSAIADAISFGAFDQDAAGQLSNLGAEMSSTPDGEISGDDDSGAGTPSPGSPGAEAGAMTEANDAALGFGDDIGSGPSGDGGASGGGGGGMGDSPGSPSGSW